MLVNRRAGLWDDDADRKNPMTPFHIHPKRAVALLAAVTVLLIASSVTVLLWEMRKRDLERSRLDTASLAHMLREQTERTFEGADQVLRGVQDRMQTSFGKDLPLEGPEVRLLLGSRIIGSPQLDLLAITDGEGRVVNSSRDDPHLSNSIAGTDYYKAFVSGASDGLYIDRPVRIGREWIMDLARPVIDDHGTLRGVVVVTMKIPRLDQFYSWLQMDYARPIAMYLADGTLLASAPARDNLIGDRPPELGRGPPPVDGPQVRTVVHRAGDGSQQIFAFARVGPFPLLVSVTSDDEPALASWRERAVSIAFGALLVCIFTVIVAVVLSGELTREERLAGALRDANERYHRTVESLMDAIVSVDDLHNVTLFNPAAERMFGVPAKEALGAPISRLIPERAREAHAYHLACFMQLPDTGNGMELNRDVTGLRCDGTEFPMESTLAHTTVDGRSEVTAVLRDVTERRRAERELRESNRQLRALSASLQDVREQERARIAAELHDELGQQLTGLKLELSWCASRVREGRPPTIDQVDAMRHQLDATIASVRRIATELRPRVLDDLGFGEALAWQASEFARRSGLVVDVDFAASECVTDDAVATALFRIVQESLTNIARHAEASRVTVQLRLGAADDALVLRVRDDGKGIAPGRDGKGIGLLSMRERALSLGGRLAVASRPGEGTTIEVVLPVRVAATHEETAA
jgi:PAS domain S-box-containing protein